MTGQNQNRKADAPALKRAKGDKKILFAPGNPRQEGMQRMQIGGIGIVAVLLLVSLANMVLDRASNEAPVTDALEASVGESGNTPTIPVEEAPTEPLAELGVTPAPATDNAPQTDGAGLPADKGQLVPDLEPDPNLEQPMDKEL